MEQGPPFPVMNTWKHWGQVEKITLSEGNRCGGLRSVITLFLATKDPGKVPQNPKGFCGPGEISDQREHHQPFVVSWG